MPKKPYKNKGVPVKGSEMRVTRTIRLTDSAWDGITEVAKTLNFSRGDLIEWWTAMLTHNEEKLQEIAANENMNLEQLNTLFWEQMPDVLKQGRANQPPKGFPVRVKPAKDDD